MTDLLSWLSSQLDHDEQVANRAIGDLQYRREEGARWIHDVDQLAAAVVMDGRGEVVFLDDALPIEDQAAHIALHDPARVLRQVAAHRRLLDRHRPSTEADLQQAASRVWVLNVCMGCEPGHQGGVAWPCDNVGDLASIYAAPAPVAEGQPDAPLVLGSPEISPTPAPQV